MAVPVERFKVTHFNLENIRVMRMLQCDMKVNDNNSGKKTPIIMWIPLKILLYNRGSHTKPLMDTASLSLATTIMLRRLNFIREWNSVFYSNVMKDGT